MVDKGSLTVDFAQKCHFAVLFVSRIPLLSTDSNLYGADEPTFLCSQYSNSIRRQGRFMEHLAGFRTDKL